MDPSSPSQTPSRIVHRGDAVAWLRVQPVLAGCSMITSLPDISEVPLRTVAEWSAWFVDAAQLVIERCPPEGVAIFYQTDIKRDGAWVDKGYLCSKAAERAGCATLFHKIVCRAPAGRTTFGRPAYSHLLCFAPALRLDLARATPDVLPEGGESVWTRGIGLSACASAVRFVRDCTQTRTVVDPFAGRGTVLAVANALGLDAVGVELSQRRARQSESLRVDALPDGSLRFRPSPRAPTEGDESP